MNVRARVAVTVAVTALTLVGCGQGRTPVDAPAAPPAPEQFGRGTGGEGAVTVALTSPAALSGHADTGIACTVSNRRYTAAGSDLAIDDYTVDVTITARGYTGPGQYAAVVSLTLVDPDDQDIGVTLPAVPVDISDSGGTFSFDTTNESGRHIAGTVRWDCQLSP